MGSHSVTCHPTQVNAPHLTLAMQAGTRFSFPGGMEGWVDLVDLIAPRPGVESATFWLPVRRHQDNLHTSMALCVECVFCRSLGHNRVNQVEVDAWQFCQHLIELYVYCEFLLYWFLRSYLTEFVHFSQLLSEFVFVSTFCMYPLITKPFQFICDFNCWFLFWLTFILPLLFLLTLAQKLRHWYQVCQTERRFKVHIFSDNKLKFCLLYTSPSPRD